MSPPLKPACILFLLLHAPLTAALAETPSGKMQKLTSRLETTSAMHTLEGFTIRWHAAYGVNYRVRWSGDLVTWDDLVSLYTGNGAEAEVTDAAAPAGGRFYRVEVFESP